MHVFTYGSLMFAEIWQVVVGREFETVEGFITGYSVYQVRRGAYPGMIATAAEEVVRGLVYLNIDAAAITRLDRFEGQFYERLSLAVDCNDGRRRTADAFVVPERNRRGLTAKPWTPGEFVASGGIADFTRRFQGFSRLEAED